MASTADWNYVAITQWLLVTRPHLWRTTNRAGHSQRLAWFHNQAHLPGGDLPHLCRTRRQGEQRFNHRGWGSDRREYPAL